MAYLNLRERRIEAKIAYVGAAIEQLEAVGKVEKAVSSEDDVLSLSWQPSVREHFKDCDVFVNVVAPRGEMSVDRVDALLADADGVVIVGNAKGVKESLARRTVKPVVLEVAALDDKTAQTALDAVLVALQSEKPNSETKSGHPLLDALREVFRDTVREQMRELEQRVNAQFEQAIDLHQKRSQADVGLAIQVVELLQDTDNRVREVNTSLASVSMRLDRMRAEKDQNGTAMANLKKCVEGLTADVRAIDGRFDELSPRLDEIEASTAQRSQRIEQSVRSFGIDFTAALASTHEKISALETRVSEIVEELKKPKKGWFT